MGIVLLVLMIIGGVTGTAAAVIALYKGRMAAAWFFGGLAAGTFLHVIGATIILVIVSVLPNKKLEAARQQYVERERRRLREQLRQERLKNEAFRQYTSDRLDTHDAALGLDTRTRDALPPAAQSAMRQLNSAGAPADVPGGGALPPANPSAAVWFYERQGAAKGPVSANDIRQLLHIGTIADVTLVWSQDLGQWTPARQVPVFRDVASRASAGRTPPA
ncbi:MAG: DUF4339 domain-containing protein [Phycisphaerae bacterium]|nr:DUF4339 domain-containing protein [Phycisphaerae bacterium]